MQGYGGSGRLSGLPGQLPRVRDGYAEAPSNGTAGPCLLLKWPDRRRTARAAYLDTATKSAIPLLTWRGPSELMQTTFRVRSPVLRQTR